MGASEDTIRLLTSMEASLREIASMLRAVAPKPVADAKELDGKYGDPEIKFNPRDWTGDDCKGKHMSECPAAFLEMVAETFDYFAGQAESTNETYKGKPVAPYKRKDAARARGWAARIRGGYKPTGAEGWATSAEDGF